MRHMVLAILRRDERFMICEIWDQLMYEHSIEDSCMTIQCVLPTEGYTRVSVCDGYPNSWLMRINEHQSILLGNLWHSIYVNRQRVHILSQEMNREFFTSTRHRKKTLRFGIKKASQRQKKMVSTVRWNRISILHFGVTEAYRPLISKKVSAVDLKQIFWSKSIRLKKMVYKNQRSINRFFNLKFFGDFEIPPSRPFVW